MKTSTQPKPSELAMKAAVALFPRGYAWGAKDEREQANKALIIDRETNLPALLKQRDALKEALGDLLRDSLTAYRDLRQPPSDAYNRAEAALALCDKVEDAPQAISMHLWLKEGGHNLVVETTMDKDGRLHQTVKK